jgi:hypothetical protein
MVMLMEHPSEDFGAVPPDQIPEAYAPGPSSGPASDTVGESPGDAAPDGDDEPFQDPGAVPGGAERHATGEPRVDAALARLDDLAGLPVTEHRAVFDDVHRRLRDVLGELDTGQLSGAGDAAGAESRRGR